MALVVAAMRAKTEKTVVRWTENGMKCEAEFERPRPAHDLEDRLKRRGFSPSVMRKLVR